MTSTSTTTRQLNSFEIGFIESAVRAAGMDSVVATQAKVGRVVGPVRDRYSIDLDIAVEGAVRSDASISPTIVGTAEIGGEACGFKLGISRGWLAFLTIDVAGRPDDGQEGRAANFQIERVALPSTSADEDGEGWTNYSPRALTGHEVLLVGTLLKSCDASMRELFTDQVAETKVVSELRASGISLELEVDPLCDRPADLFSGLIGEAAFELLSGAKGLIELIAFHGRLSELRIYRHDGGVVESIVELDGGKTFIVGGTRGES